MPLGASYSPLNQEDPTQRKPQAGAPVQEAIKMLSLRMPRVQGAQAIAPSALLNAPGSASMSLDALRKLLQQLGGGGAGPASPSAPSLTPPSVPSPAAPSLAPPSLSAPPPAAPSFTPPATPAAPAPAETAASWMSPRTPTPAPPRPPLPPAPPPSAPAPNFEVPAQITGGRGPLNMPPGWDINYEPLPFGYGRRRQA